MSNDKNIIHIFDNETGTVVHMDMGAENRRMFLFYQIL